MHCRLADKLAAGAFKRCQELSCRPTAASMGYNWADPKKNTKLSSLLMCVTSALLATLDMLAERLTLWGSSRRSKAEASRKKRLTSVRSTLSNQLHPTVENKLRSWSACCPVRRSRRAFTLVVLTLPAVLDG